MSEHEVEVEQQPQELEEVDFTPAIEQQALEQIRESLRNVAKPTQSVAGPTKKQLIARIEELHAARAIDHVPSRFARMTKSELKEYIGATINAGVSEHIASTEAAIVEEQQNIATEGAPESSAGGRTSRTTPDEASRALYMLNHTMSRLLEQASYSPANPTNLRCVGYSDHIEANRSDLLDAYRDLYLEYQAELAPYVTPVNRIILINGYGILGSVVQKNTEQQ
jgi:hypothetical protein